MGEFTKLFEAQTGGYPLNQVLLIEAETEDGATEPAVVAFFADVEMDVFSVEFGVDGEIIFDTSGYSYLMTSPEQLVQIAEMAEEAKVLQAELSEHFDADAGEWKGHEHLLYRPQE